jgi:predicted TIM-barrel fold metal-dependent hydrolase
VPVIAAFFNLLVSDLDTRFPRLRFGFLEASAAWVPFAMQRAARKLYPDDPAATVGGELMRQKNLFLACMSEEDLPYITSQVGDDMLVLGTDFGHTDLGTEIEGHLQVAERGDIGSDTKRKILSDNARRLYALPA